MWKELSVHSCFHPFSSDVEKRGHLTGQDSAGHRLYAQGCRLFRGTFFFFYYNHLTYSQCDLILLLARYWVGDQMLQLLFAAAHKLVLTVGGSNGSYHVASLGVSGVRDAAC